MQLSSAQREVCQALNAYIETIKVKGLSLSHESKKITKSKKCITQSKQKEEHIRHKSKNDEIEN